MKFKDLLNPTIIHRPFDSLLELFIGEPERFEKLFGPDQLFRKERDPTIARQSASFNSLSVMLNFILDVNLFGGWRFNKGRDRIISGKNEDKSTLNYDKKSGDNLFASLLIIFAYTIFATLLQAVNLIKLTISPVTVLPYFFYKHGFLKGLKETGKFVINHLDTLAGNLIGIVLSVTIYPISFIIAIFPFSRWIAKRRIEKYNQNHPLVETIFDLASQNDNDAMEQAIDTLMATEEFSPEQKEKYVFEVTFQILRANPIAITGLINNPAGFNAAVDNLLHYAFADNIELIKNIIQQRVETLLDRLPREDILQEAYHILKFPGYRACKFYKLEELIDHIVLNHERMKAIPNEPERQKILYSLMDGIPKKKKLNVLYEDWMGGVSNIPKPLQTLLNLLNIPEFFDSLADFPKHPNIYYRSMYRDEYKLVLLFYAQSFIKEIHQVDFSIKNNVLTGCYVLRELIKNTNKLYGEKGISWVQADIRYLLEIKEIRHQLINENDVKGKNNLEQILGHIQKLDADTQDKLLFTLLENVEISESLMTRNYDQGSIAILDRLKQIEPSTQESAKTRGIGSGPTKSASHNLYPGMFKPSANAQEVTDCTENRYGNSPASVARLFANGD